MLSPNRGYSILVMVVRAIQFRIADAKERMKQLLYFAFSNRSLFLARVPVTLLDDNYNNI